MKIFIIFFWIISSLPVWSVELSYLIPEDVDLTDFPAPPKLNSSEDLADLEHVFYLQSIRTQADCERAKIEDEGLATSFFAAPYGPLTKVEAERLVEFQEKLFKEVNFFARILKRQWMRKRPFSRDPRIQPCVPFQASDSYPSGHAAASYVAAQAFSLLYPSYQLEFDQRSKVIAEDRVIGGVHHPLDVMAGRELGKRVFRELLKSEAFHKDLLQNKP